MVGVNREEGMDQESREQVRRDAERFIAYAGEVTRQKPDSSFPRQVLALLAELEQAEQRWQEQEHPFDALEFKALKDRAEQAERERDEARVQRGIFNGQERTLDEFRTRALSAEQREAALVEALRHIKGFGEEPNTIAADIARAALTAHEQAKQ